MMCCCPRECFELNFIVLTYIAFPPFKVHKYFTVRNHSPSHSQLLQFGVRLGFDSAHLKVIRQLAHLILMSALCGMGCGSQDFILCSRVYLHMSDWHIFISGAQKNPDWYDGFFIIVCTPGTLRHLRKSVPNDLPDLCKTINNSRVRRLQRLDIFLPDLSKFLRMSLE